MGLQPMAIKTFHVFIQEEYKNVQIWKSTPAATVNRWLQALLVGTDYDEIVVAKMFRI